MLSSVALETKFTQKNLPLIFKSLSDDNNLFTLPEIPFHCGVQRVVMQTAIQKIGEHFENTLSTSGGLRPPGPTFTISQNCIYCIFTISHHNIITLKSQIQLEIDKINNWMISNKLTINCKKSYYMIVGNTKSVDKAKFNLTINHNLIKKSEFVKYLGVFLDDKLSWKIHIEKICQKLSRVCGMMHKLRYYVPLSTRKLVYFSLFHSQLQYSLLNWGRAAKSNLQKLVILQNKILRASLFRPKHHQTTLLYSEFGVLKLENMINMEFAKFMYKFNNKMLPESFNNYFTKLDDVHKYKTRQKHRNEFFQFYIASKTGQKNLRHICINVWKNVPAEY